MPDSPTSAMPPPAAPARHPGDGQGNGGRLKRLAFLAFKIVIAVLGIWYVSRTLTWNDSAIVRAGATINALEIVEDTPVTVVARQPAANGTGDMITVRFPSTPIKVRVEQANGQPLETAVAFREGAVLPGAGEALNVRQEMVLVPALQLKERAGEFVSPGLRSLLRTASTKWQLVLMAWILLGMPFFVTAIRWRNLMRPQGIDMPLGKCLQLTFVGQFYSILLPGITGGDLVKIVYAARLTGSKTKSFITIVLDRVIGLVALMVIAGTSAGVQVALNHRDGQPDETLFNVFVMIVIMLIVLATGATIYFSHRLRRLVGIEWFVEHFGANDSEQVRHDKMEHLFRVVNALILGVAAAALGALAMMRWGLHLPWAQNQVIVLVGMAVAAVAAIAAGLGLLLHEMVVHKMTPVMGRLVEALVRVDETLRVYRGHFGLLLWAFLISLVSQLTLPLSAYLSGRALGMTAPLTHFLAYVPLAVLAASLPVSPPQGFGLLDGLMVHFFAERGVGLARASAGQAFALAQSVRFLPLIWNLFGAYWVVTGKYGRQGEVTAAVPPDGPAIAPAPTES